MAEPFKITAIFLSPGVATSMFLDGKDHFLPGKIVFNQDKCIKMGDHCFHPQYGIVKEGREQKEERTETKNIEHKSLSFEEVDEIKCQDGGYFDFYCGKAKEIKKKPVDLEVWIDTSSSMKRVDMSMSDDQCKRSYFSSLLKSSCEKNPAIYAFNTSKKEILKDSYLCMNVGANDQKKMVRWMKNSRVKHLVIITDVDEYNGEFRTYLDQVGATIEGIGIKPLYAKDMHLLIGKLSSSCSK